MPTKDNAMLLPSHYMANYRGYEWLIGPGKGRWNPPSFSCLHRIVRQRQILLAQQYSGAFPWAALSRNHHSR